MNKKFIVPLIAVLLIGIVAGGYLYLRRESASDEEETATIAEAEPLVETLFDGFTEGNYEKASTYFSGEMRSEMTEEVFTAARSQILEKIGNLVSLGDPEISTRDENTIFTYNAQFEEETGVKVEVVFGKEGGEDWRITGLWFDSPKLRE